MSVQSVQVPAFAGAPEPQSPSGIPLDELARRLFDARDSVCLDRAELVTWAWRRYENQPRPILRARALAHVLQRMTLDLHTNPIFAGNTSSAPRAWMLMPEYQLSEDCQVAFEHQELRDFLAGKVPREMAAFWRGRCAADLGIPGDGGQGHLAVDLDTLVHHGAGAILRQCTRRRSEPGLPREQLVYLEAMEIALQAMIAWAHRYAQAAEQAAEQAQEAGESPRAEWHRRVARACRQVPEHPARNFFEGLQAILLAHLALAIEGQALSVSIGLPDRVLARFVPEVELDPQGAADLVAAFLLKIAANSIYGKGSKTQAITIGGADHQGRDRCNALTRAFLEAFDRVPVSDPHLFLRWHRGLDPAIEKMACHMLSRGRSMPLWVNDHPTTTGLVDAGVAAPDAWDYCIIGCNELGIPGRLFDSALSLGAGYNDLALLNHLLLETAPEDLARIHDMTALLGRLESEYVRHFRRVLPRRGENARRIARLMPSPLTTALMSGAAQRAEDYMQAMPYRTPGLFTRGLSNAVDALAAIDVLVFRSHRYPLALLASALRDDLADVEFREQLAQLPAWGNDDQQVDRLAVELVALRRRALALVQRELGLDRHVVCHVVRSLHHFDGRRIKASLDGRRAGQPVGDSLGALGGKAKQGPTAMLASVCKLDAARDFAGGYNLNLTLPPSQAGPLILSGLVRGFFGDHGQELQINVLDADQLLAARRCPELHRDLVVRVAGLSARFVELSDTQQLELIARAQAVRG